MGNSWDLARSHIFRNRSGSYTGAHLLCRPTLILQMLLTPLVGVGKVKTGTLQQALDYFNALRTSLVLNNDITRRQAA